MKNFHYKGALDLGSVFFAWIRIGSRKINGSGSGLDKFMDPDCPQRLDPVNIRPDPKPCMRVNGEVNLQ